MGISDKGMKILRKRKHKKDEITGKKYVSDEEEKPNDETIRQSRDSFGKE